MKIAIDAWVVAVKPRTGVETYGFNLLNSLAAVDADNSYTLYVNDTSPADLTIRNDNFKVKKLSYSHKPWIPWRYVRLPLELLSNKPDIFLSLTPVLPFYHPHKAIVVVHDISPLIFREYGFKWRITFGRRTAHAVKYARRIIAVSQYTKEELLKLFKIDSEKVSIIYEGYDANIYKPELDAGQIKAVTQKYNITSNYILSVGTLEPRKNIPRLIEAFASLKREWAVSHKLVIAGGKGWHYDSIFREVDKLNLNEEVIFTGYIPQEDLPLLMSGADVFVFPSLYEGFGLPPLEAMACGTPVITSNISSLPEVIGDAGILIDPYSVEEIAQAIYRVVSNSGLQQQMRQRGLKRAKMFSWEKAARETLEVFESVYREED